MKRFLTLVLPLLAVCAFAQDMAPVVPKQIEDLKWQVGEWQGTVKMSMQGMDLEMTSVMKISQRDAFLVYDSTHEYMGVKMTELAYFWWDGAKDRYSMLTLTNMAETPRYEHGSLKGDTLTMVSDPWSVQGTSMVSQAKLTKISNDEIKFVISFKEGDAWTIGGEGIFKRKK